MGNKFELQAPLTLPGIRSEQPKGRIMSNTVQAILDSQEAPNHILYSLLYFLRVEQPDLVIDINAPIDQIEECFLVMAAVLVELCLGIDVPDALLTDRSQTFVQLADVMRTLPKFSDEVFQWQLLRVKAALRAEADMNKKARRWGPSGLSENQIRPPSHLSSDNDPGDIISPAHYWPGGQRIFSLILLCWFSCCSEEIRILLNSGTVFPVPLRTT